MITTCCRYRQHWPRSSSPVKVKNKAFYTGIASVACLLAVAGEAVTMFVFGSQYPGYSQLKNTMSSMGASVSPVSNQISTWWVMMGILLILFGAGVKIAFSEKGRYAGWASWLIILYGAGEGLGSGLFKADRFAGGLTTSALIHDIVGGIGVIAILILPLVMQKVIPKNAFPFFSRMSRIIFICGILTILLFLFRYSSNKDNFLAVNKGLWQRLFMLNTYLYMATIAIIMLLPGRKPSIADKQP
jgi:hypothetical protein